MSELKAINLNSMGCYNINEPIYLKSEADKVIADLEESHKKEVEQLLMEIVKLKDAQRWLELAEKFKEWK